MKKTTLLLLVISLFLSALNCPMVKETKRNDDILEHKQEKSTEAAERELDHLFKMNPVLVEEFRKLPELKMQLDEKRLLALNRIVKYYTQSPNPEEAGKIFERILSIGKKERRKFSAPLQALFWLAEESEIPFGENPLHILSKEDYAVNKHLGEDEGVIVFVHNVWEKTYETDKWRDADEIMDRLNSPHLFDIFFRDNILYDMPKHHRKSGDGRYHENWSSYLQAAKETIQTRKGTCDDATVLAEEILTKAGYTVVPLQVRFVDRRRHWVGVLKEGGLLYKIADDYLQDDGVAGPFRSYKDIGTRVAESHSATMKDFSCSIIPIR